MDSKREGCDELPEEIVERVLSFLPVPVLCRMRSVCKTWRKLISRPSFHNLCDRNGPNKVYLFMWNDKLDHWRRRRGVVDPNFTEGTLSFLDVDAGRWYSIPAAELPRVGAGGGTTEARFMAVDNGLVCELTTSRGVNNNLALTLSDPIAKTTTLLPAPPQFYSYGDALPHLVTIVDDAAGSYKVFLLNTLCRHGLGMDTLMRVYVYESSTNEWRIHRNLPNRVEGLWVFSAVAFQQTVLVSRTILDDFGFDAVMILSYKPQEDKWVEVWRMNFYREILNGRLIVTDNRLFYIMWTLDHPRRTLNPHLSNRDCPNFESLFQTNQDYREALFEVYEVLIPENGRRPVVQLTNVQLRQIFGTDDPTFDVACGFPCLGSNGMCNSIVLVSSFSGLVRRYHLATGSVDILPPHPLLQASEEPASVEIIDLDDIHDVDPSRYYYDAKTTKLSLRNLLSERRNSGTSTG